MPRIFVCTLILLIFTSISSAQSPQPQAPSSPGAVIRAGIIGLDTSHCIAFTKLFNDPKSDGDLAGIRIVAAFPGGSPDIESSASRVQGYTKEAQGLGVEIVDSIPDLLKKVDVVLLESVDGRPHLAQARPVLEAGKPVFIDKPLAGSLADAVAIAELGEKTKTPWFSSSSLRFGPTIQSLRHDPKLGDISGCVAWGPAPIEKTHPDLFWYGIHGVEIMYTLMGTGCQTVTRSHTQDTDVVTGIWKDGRVATFRGNRTGKHDYGFVVFGAQSIVPQMGFEGYKPLAVEIAKFFKTRKPPVAAEETIELLAFMEAADESKRQNGAPVKIQTVLAKAREEAKAK